MNGGSNLKVNQSAFKQIVLIVLGTALVLWVPFCVMQFTDEVNWDLFDFAIAAMLLVGAGLIYMLLARKVSNTRFRAIFAGVLAVTLFLVWAEFSVGIFGSPFAGI